MASLSAKERVTFLSSARETMEYEMAVISGRLSLPGSPGLKGPLVDTEGFPIPGVDLYQVRADRGRYHTLRNDHAAVSTELAVALVDATKELGAMQGVGDVTISGSTSIGQETSTAKISSVPSTSVGNETPSSPPTPFAVIDDVVSGSPAETGGLQIGDQIVSFGDVSKNAEQGRDISQVAAASVTAAAAGETKIVTVLRRGAVVTLEVQPRTWQGRGFLGCHMRPL